MTGTAKEIRARYHKSAADQISRRRDKVVEYTLAGYSVKDIAVALNVTDSVVSSDRLAMRQWFTGQPKATWKSRRPAVPPARYDWRQDRDAEIPGYELTSPVRYVQVMMSQMEDGNGLNRVAHNVAEAQTANDTRWLIRSQRLIEQAIDYLQDCVAVFQSEQVRHHAASSLTARDDLHGRSLSGSRNALPFPPKDTGQLPGIVFAYLWRVRWAGLPLDDPQQVKLISRSLKLKPERVAAAIREFEEKYKD